MSQVSAANQRLLDAYRAAGHESPDLTVTPAERSRIRVAARVSAGMAFSATESDGFAIAVGVPQAGSAFQFVGTLGENLDIEAGARAAELSALSALSELQGVIGDLARVQKVMFMQVFMTAASGFTGHAAVAEGGAKAMRAVLGDRAATISTAAIGIVSVPAGLAIELIAFFQLAR